MLQEQSGKQPANSGQSITIAPGQPPAPPAVGSGVAPAARNAFPGGAAAPAGNGGGATAAPTAAKKFCPECGKEVAAGAKFCPACGAKIGG